MGTLDDARDAVCADVVEDGHQLVGRWGVLGDLELELGPLGAGVLGRALCGSGRRLRQGGGHPRRGRRGGLVEEGDDVERFALKVH